MLYEQLNTKPYPHSNIYSSSNTAYSTRFRYHLAMTTNTARRYCTMSAYQSKLSHHYWEFHQQTTSWRQCAVGEYCCWTSCVYEWCAESIAFAWWRRPAAPAQYMPPWQCSSSPANSTRTTSTNMSQRHSWTCRVQTNWGKTILIPIN